MHLVKTWKYYQWTPVETGMTILVGAFGGYLIFIFLVYLVGFVKRFHFGSKG